MVISMALIDQMIELVVRLYMYCLIGRNEHFVTGDSWTSGFFDGRRVLGRLWLSLPVMSECMKACCGLQAQDKLPCLRLALS